MARGRGISKSENEVRERKEIRWEKVVAQCCYLSFLHSPQGTSLLTCASKFYLCLKRSYYVLGLSWKEASLRFQSLAQLLDHQQGVEASVH